MYFIKRGEKTRGPISHKQLLEFVKAKKIVGSDLVSTSADGPFQELKSVWGTIKNSPKSKEKMPTAMSSSSAQSPPTPTVPVSVVPERSPNEPPPLADQTATSDRRNWLLIGGIAGGLLMALLVVAVVVAILMKNSGQGPKPKKVASNDGSPITTGDAGDAATENKQNAKPIDISDRTEFAEAVFETLKADDCDSFIAIVSCDLDRLKSVPELFNINFFNSTPEKKHSEIENNYKKAFSKVRQFMESDSGLDWELAKLIQHNYRADIVGYDWRMNLHLVVAMGDQSYDVHLNSIVEFPSDKVIHSFNSLDVIKTRAVGYVVPDKIEKLPSKYKGPELYDYVAEIKKNEPGLKGKFEKTEDYQRRVKETWSNATLFGQPVNNRWIYVIESKSSYDADKEEMQLSLEDKPSKLFGPDEETDYRVLFLNLANLDIKSKSLSLKIPPEEARKIMSQLRIAYVFRFGPHSGTSPSPLKLTMETRAEKDSYIYPPLGLDPIKVQRGTLLSEHYDLWVKELNEIIVFREDTGEIVHRMEMEPRSTQGDADNN